ncbi:Ammonium transporter 1 member 1 [Hondaea fermentalgiana]|uniref:Ammonium transporter n=1 Tax=Hondaea fermentalgiana TaxID=2315210 RepID=A0A2R5GWL3_9STRA|nr:Ammonium transporter 1 member 1 [Hondaea fermentalgiana]|eukprot:GBG34719.1 Ammonium transporter 1 member 1 [Hondaea fermentalgiana]
MSLNVSAIEGLGDAAAAVEYVGASADNIWMLIAGFLVFWMHAGFCMLEAGSVQHKNSVNICFKNLGTVTISAIMYYLIGWGFAYGPTGGPGDDGANTSASYGFIGTGAFTLEGLGASDMALFFFQFAFCATAATIVSGAVAGRINLIAYFIIAVYLTGFVYPVVSHWIWATGGFISGFTDPAHKLFGSCGMVDFAGSGVVHMTGGVSALIFAKVLGPRKGRFDADGSPLEIPPHNIALQTLGVFILWFGWYGFNCGSTLAWSGDLAGHVAVTTTLAPSAAVITCMIVQRFLTGTFDIGSALNGALAGLVSITAPCAVAPVWGAIIIGILGGLIYIGASKLVVKIFKVDDPVDAIAVHGICGAWGVVAAALFGAEASIESSYSCPDFDRGMQLGVQLVGIFTIVAWCTLTCLPLALLLKVTGLLRVSESDEEMGLDASEHGAQAYVSGKSAKLSPA